MKVVATFLLNLVLIIFQSQGWEKIRYLFDCQIYRVFFLLVIFDFNDIFDI